MCKIDHQTNNFQNSNNEVCQDFRGATIGVQKNEFLVKFRKTNRYDIDNLSKKDIIIPEENQIQIFDIRKLRKKLYIFSQIHIVFTFAVEISILLLMMTSIDLLPFYAYNFVFISFILFLLSYVSLYIKSKHKEYTDTSININLQNLITMKTINSKITNYRFIPSILYCINHIVEPFYNYYAYVILIDEEQNETYLHFKTRNQYKDFNTLITRFYKKEVITD